MKNKKYMLLIIFIVVAVSLLLINGDYKKTKSNLEKKGEGVLKMDTEKKVSDNIIKVSDLSYKTEKIKIYGKTESKSQVDVFAEVPARIKKINVRLGDYVSSGQIIITLDSQGETNKLNQARLSLKSANLGLNKTLAGPRDEELKNIEESVKIKNENLEKIKNDINKNISDLETSLEAILRKEIDNFFDHTDRAKSIYHPTFTYRLKSQAVIYSLEETRKDLETDFNIFINTSLEQKTLEEKIAQALNIAQKFSDLSEKLYNNSKDFIGFSAAETDAFEVQTLSTLDKVKLLKKTLETLENSLKNQISALEIAQNNLRLGEAGASNEDIDVSKSNIEIAQNSVTLAKIALSKKILRAPISGQITSINADIGKIPSNSYPLFSIHNSKNLKIEAKISQQNLDSIFVGKEILIKKIPAKVVSISTILNPQGSVDFEAEFIKKNNLLSGENVEIEIEKKLKEKKEWISLPLSSVFEKDNIYFVYTLDADSKTKETEVIFEKIDGDKIIIKNTFSENESLIENSRGVSNNQKI